MKKLALYFVSFCSFFFVGCSDSSPTPTEFTVTYKSDASTEVGTEKVPVATPMLTKNTSLVEGKYIVGFFTDETKMTAFDFSKNLTADVTIYVTFKDIVTPADKAALVTEIDKAIAAEGNSPNLNYINTEKVKDMNSLFNGKTNFNGDISEWNVGAVTDMNGMFGGTMAFNGDISKWDVSAVTDMNGVFLGASNFNGDISKWNVAAVNNTTQMFQGASNFNGDISKWKVSVVGDMTFMFFGATAFNQDISSWDVSGVDNMAGMFKGASAFNQDISSWDVSALLNARSMFEDATAFDQDLDAWSTHLTLDDNGKFTSSDPLFSKTDMFKGTLREDNPPSWY